MGLYVLFLNQTEHYHKNDMNDLMWAPGLPKTRSGKIMRRILRKIAADDFENFGDTSTLADPSVVDNLVAGRKKML